MPIGTGIIYNVGDLILSQVSGSGTSFLETKIAAATSSIVYFDSTARINSASLNSITVGTASYVSGSRSIITNLTASNISASGTGSFGMVGIGTVNPAYKLHVEGTSFFNNTISSSNKVVVESTQPGIILRETDQSGSTHRWIDVEGGTFRILQTNNDYSSFTTQFVINSSGNVGIGTTAPGALLEISSSTAASLLNVKGAGGNAILFVSGSGNVGIGSSSPAYKLDVTGNARVGDSLYVTTATTSDASIEIGRGRSGNGNSYVDLIGDATYTDYGLRLIRSNTGANATSAIAHRGTGTFYITTVDAGSIALETTNTTRMTITSGGNVGIGTTSATTKLYVSGSVTALDGRFISNVTSGTDKYFLDCYGTSTNQIFALYENSNTAYLNSYSSMAFRANQNGGSGGYFVFSGANVGIATTAPADYLEVVGSGANGIRVSRSGLPTQFATLSAGATGPTLNVSSAIGELSFGIAGTAASAMTLNSTGLGIGTTAPGAKLEISSSTAASLLNIKGAGGNGLLFVSGSGNVGIGTTVPGALLDVSYGDYQSAGTVRIGADLGANTSRTNVSRKWGLITGYNYTNASAAIPIIGYDSANTYTAINIGGGTSSIPASPTYISFFTTSSLSTYGAERVRIISDGNVGIGTTSPANKLHIIVAGGLYNASITNQSQLTGSVIIQADNSGANSRASLIMRGSDTIGGAISVAREDTSPTWRTYMAFYTNNVTSVNVTDIQEKMRLNADGNLGIGTTVPAYLLDVSGSSRHGYRAADTHQFTGSVSLTGGLFATNITASNISASRYTGSSAYFSNIGFTDQTVASDTSTFPTGSTSDGLILDGGVYTNGVYRTRFVKVDRGANLSLYIQETKGSSGSFSNLARFGTHTNSPNTFEVFGSTNIQGSITSSNFVGPHIGNTIGTASWASNALTASFLPVGTYNITSSWANNVVSASYALTSSFATTAQTANALNVANTYTIAGLTSAYVDVNGSGTIPTTGIYRPSTKTLGLSADGTLIFKISNVSSPATSSIETGNFIVQTGNVGIGTTIPNSKLQISGSSAGLLTVGTLTNDWAGVVAIGTPNGNGIILSKVNTSNDANRVLTIVRDDTNGASIFGYTPTGTSTSVGFQIRASASSYFNGGNVGIGTSSPDTKLDVRGVVQSQSYPVVNTSGTGQWVKLGTLTIPQSGYTAHIRAYIHSGYNALNSQDYYLDIFFKTSNASSVDANGFAGNSWYYTRGYTTSDPSPIWVGNAAGVSATAYDLYLSLPAFTNRSHYIVEIVEGVTWANVGSLGQTYPGTGSSTVCVSSLGFTLPIGNVGIGTSTLTTKFNVYDASSGNADEVFLGTIGTNQLVGGRTDGSFGIATKSASNGNLIFTANNGMYFRTSGSNDRMFIKNDGNVGIGTTSPVQKFHLDGVVGNPATSGTAQGGMVRLSNTTDNAVLDIGMRSGGAGAWLQSTDETSLAANYPLLLNPNGGNVGIGTTNPVAKLQVAGNISGSSFTSSISNAVGFLGTSSWAQNVVSASFATTAQTANALNTGNSYTVGSLTSTTQIGGTTGTIQSLVTPGIYSNGLSTGNAIAITSNTTFANQGAWANLGLHQTTANANDLTAKVYLAIGGWYQNSGTGLPVYIGGGYTSNSSSVLSVVPVDTAGNGNVGIGTAAPAAKLEITGSSNSVLLNIKSPISGAILYVSGSGAVGIGTSNVGAYTLQVSGSFAATTKSFVIEHPTKAGKKLIYGSLESPYHGIRLTGRDTLKEGKCKIQLPDYIYKLILHDSVNIQLTGIKCNKTLYVDEINIPENYFTIAYDKAIFESYKDYDFFWDFTGIRTDVPELITEL